MATHKYSNRMMLIFLMILCHILVAKTATAQDAHWAPWGSTGFTSCSVEFRRPHSDITVGEYFMDSCMDSVSQYPAIYGGCRIFLASTCKGQILRLKSCPSDQVYTYNYPSGQCKTPKDENDGKPCGKEKQGNPINIVTGNKYQSELDYVGSGPFPLRYRRSYNSSVGDWRSLPTLGLMVNGESQPAKNLYLIDAEINSVTFSEEGYYYHPDFSPEKLFVTDFEGRGYYFYKSGGTWSSKSVAQVALVEINDVSGELEYYQFTNLQDERFLFDRDGVIQSHADRNGFSHLYSHTYDPADGEVIVVTDITSNEVMTIYRDSVGRVERIVTPESAEYRYAFNSNGLLEYVSYPDNRVAETGNNPFGEGNPIRQYHYEDANNGSLLTGITDERGVRYVSWRYDSSGRATSSKYEAPSVATGTDEITIDYADIEDGVDPRVVVTNSQGKLTTYHISTFKGLRKVTYVEGAAHNATDPATACVAANQVHQYDSNGFVNLVIDWESNAIDYDHDIRGLEIRREVGRTASVNPSTTPPTITLDPIDPQNDLSRIITTNWHPNFRLPTRITKPDQVIGMSYDCNTGEMSARQIWPLGSEPAYVAPACP